ncbi:MAG: KH domain-containing protein [Candidatus Peregrinibacteria bacterium]|nr:KH domain-containing protein [Candidatus Peregrinibacteria bacterium]MDZ4245140.1 KH domain-containing protein [Candidatus Gracilibacteria bacterium]
MDDELFADDITDDFAMVGGSSTGDDDDTTTSVKPVASSTVGGDEGKDKDFVEFVVKQLVDDASHVTVKRKVDELGVFITVSVAKDDMGKLIGKNGQTVDALRVLLRVIGAKENSRVNLKVVEPEEV